VGADHPEGDLARLQELDEVGAGHVQELGRLPAGQLGGIGHDVHALAASQEPEDLGEQHGCLPRDHQGVIAGQIALDGDRVGCVPVRRHRLTVIPTLINSTSPELRSSL
jgi:hypothetical protein